MPKKSRTLGENAFFLVLSYITSSQQNDFTILDGKSLLFNQLPIYVCLLNDTTKTKEENTFLEHVVEMFDNAQQNSKIGSAPMQL